MCNSCQGQKVGPVRFTGASSAELPAEGSSSDILSPFSQIPNSVRFLISAFKWGGGVLNSITKVMFLCRFLNDSLMVLPFPISWICFLHLFLVD